jgi:epoxyqueuosine reductase
MDPKPIIANQAIQLGFNLVGVTTPDPPPHFEVFSSWLDAGRHAEMAYLASERSRQRRKDPCRIMPECQSILVLGMLYPSPEEDFHDIQLENRDGTKLRGRWAAYAWGMDYHDIFEEQVKALMRMAQAKLKRSVTFRWYSDTGPILERDLAQRAGLGWIGKNTNLISPRQGSYFLLAEVLLDIFLEPDSPFDADRCGSCTRCIQACPTQCILPDRTLDAGRCISYLTIELKKSIPYELRPLMGDWIFGCDICQMVCPWNRRLGKQPGNPAFQSQQGMPYPLLLDELLLTPECFQHKYRQSPVKRAKLSGYLRNIVVALGNSKNPQLIPDLMKVLKESPFPIVRGHAAWAIGQIGGVDANEGLIEARKTESDFDVMDEIDRAIQSMG